ncbi:class I SAM-dependent methyltransferase [Aquimarina sp. 2201CG5-10]|uniref:class I SAM-dependent methyltransferase n=1 Tax=Aquimarina callyspongiae TaxID=3098150 RepID=UPI002AB3B2F3|nr:class I SAM-dependent methyltransferase [Aquimarina sp. 2201CG5-10]MDY8134816.1 class I SAM-dependent methyltransferase [Aquimarina sp. 2201CG5-10]
MQAKYDSIGIGYNTTRKTDPYLFRRLSTLLNPHPNGLYLDIGCGTGNYTSEFAKKGYQFIGIDPSLEMLKKAKEKHSKVTWKIGTAEQIDIASESIDGIIASLTIHHWKDLKKGFSELNRVLKPNGKIVIFTSTPKQMKGYWLRHYFPKMLEDSITQMPSLDDIRNSLFSSKLKIDQTEKYNIQPDLQDLFLYSGKHNPKLYFNPKIRQGISSFSSLAYNEEIDKGLDFMQRDINSGQIDTVIKNYKNTLGDYLFLVINKV